MPRWQNIPKENWERAREMRHRPTKAERTLWRALRDHQLGSKFRRQHPIGPFVVDFYAPDEHLIIEVDGNTHFEAEQMEHDRTRTEFLTERGFHVLRFTNLDVDVRGDDVIAKIQAALTPLNPPAKAGGEPSRKQAEQPK